MQSCGNIKLWKHRVVGTQSCGYIKLQKHTGVGTLTFSIRGLTQCVAHFHECTPAAWPGYILYASVHCSSVSTVMVIIMKNVQMTSPCHYKRARRAVLISGLKLKLRHHKQKTETENHNDNDYKQSNKQQLKSNQCQTRSCFPREWSPKFSNK